MFDFIENFEKKTMEAFSFITQYAVNKLGFEKCNLDNNKDEFIRNVHEGFFRGQEVIVDLLSILSNLECECNTSLRIANISRNSNEIKALRKKMLYLKFQEKVVRKIADSIAWQILQFQHAYARRFYIGAPVLPFKSSNLLSVKSFADQYNKNNPLGFALLSDITSFIQIGDSLIIDKSRKGKTLVAIYEHKEGKINNEIRKFLDSFYKTKCERALYFFLKTRGKKDYEQLGRMLKQDARGYSVASIINKNSGDEFCSGMTVKISQDFFKTEHFFETIEAMAKESSKNGWAIDIINECLFVGVYSCDFPGYWAFSRWLQDLNINYPIHKLINTFATPLSLPLFLLPLPIDIKKDIIYGRKQIFLCLDFDKWFLQINQNVSDLNMVWLNKKETAAFSKKQKGYRPYIYNHKAIECSLGEKRLYLGDGVLGRMFFEFVTPLSGAKLVKRMLEES